MKWYCFIQMQLIGTFVHYFVLDCIVISIAAIICSPFVSMTHYRQALFSMTYFSSPGVFYGVCIVHFAAPAKYPDRGINRARWKYIFSFYGFVDSVTIFPYMLTYMYWDTNIVHAIILLYIFYYCKQIRYLTEEWVMAILPAASWSVFLLVLYRA